MRRAVALCFTLLALLDQRLFAGDASPAGAGRALGERPDIVFILIDDLRWNALSCMGHPFVQTPNIDRLRARGALLANAFTTTSLCSPSRASFLTGAYASRHGVFDNRGSEYDPVRTPIYPQLLQQAGYRTAMIGKWHMGTTDQPRLGFDYWMSFFGQGVYNNPNMNENGRSFQAHGYTTDLLTDYAINFIQQVPLDRPYCVILSHKAVHEPFELPERDLHIYPEAKLPRPDSYSDDFSGKPKWLRRARAYPRTAADWRTRYFEEERVPDSIPPASWPPPSAPDYLTQLRLVKSVDDSVGRVIEVLEARGSLARTMIVFASDNGYQHFEHRRVDKRVGYEESIRVPFLISYPGHIPANSTFDSIFANVDWAPTVLDYLGLPVPASMQGHSYRPVLEGRAPVEDNVVFYEYWRELTHATPGVVGVRTADWKLLRYPEQPEVDEMYHLTTDPQEMHNLSGDLAAQSQHEKLAALLDRKIKEIGWQADLEPVLPAPYEGPVRQLIRLAPEVDGWRDGGLAAVQMQRPAASPAAGRSKTESASFTGETAWESSPCPMILDTAQAAFPLRLVARVRVDRDGVIAAHDGSQESWVLFVQDGRPGFGLHTQDWTGSSTTLDGPPLEMGREVELAVVIDYARMQLWVDGRKVGDTRLAIAFRHLPDGRLLLGGGPSRTISKSHPTFGFHGDLRELRLELVSRER